MNVQLNVQRIAVDIGDIVKWTKSEKEIDRQGAAILKVGKSLFPHSAITSSRQQAIYDWLCSIGQEEMLMDERTKRIMEFCLSLSNIDNHSDIISILEAGGVPQYILFKDQLAILSRENLHPEVYKHAKSAFQHEKYSHALLEVCKAYDKAVQEKTGLENSGRSLMQQALSWRGNILRFTTGVSESDENFQEGVKLLSEGIMAGVRNISAHEPILSWPIGKEDCIDMLHLLSFLFRQLDKAVNIRSLGMS